MSPPNHISLTASDSGSEDDLEPRPKFDSLPSRTFSQPPDIDPLSPSEEADYSDDEFVMQQGQYLDELLFFGNNHILIYPMFVPIHQAFAEKAHGHDPLRSMQTWRMGFWDPPKVDLVLIRTFLTLRLSRVLVA